MDSSSACKRAESASRVCPAASRLRLAAVSWAFAPITTLPLAPAGTAVRASAEPAADRRSDAPSPLTWIVSRARPLPALTFRRAPSPNSTFCKASRLRSGTTNALPASTVTRCAPTVATLRPAASRLRTAPSITLPAPLAFSAAAESTSVSGCRAASSDTAMRADAMFSSPAPAALAWAKRNPPARVKSCALRFKAPASTAAAGTARPSRAARLPKYASAALRRISDDLRAVADGVNK